MSKMVLAIGLVSALCFPAFAEDQRLEGTYKLVSSTRQILETGQIVDTYGKQPTGYINYGRDGRMLVLIVADKNNRPAPESVGAITDEQRANLFRTMTAYGGTYKYDGHTIEHHLDISWNQVWTGTTLIRDVEKEGDKLIYTTKPAPFSGDGKMSVITLIWQKVE
jgi:Lipocalin-like domain